MGFDIFEKTDNIRFKQTQMANETVKESPDFNSAAEVIDYLIHRANQRTAELVEDKILLLKLQILALASNLPEVVKLTNNLIGILQGDGRLERVLNDNPEFKNLDFDLGSKPETIPDLPEAQEKIISEKTAVVGPVKELKPEDIVYAKLAKKYPGMAQFLEREDVWQTEPGKTEKLMSTEYISQMFETSTGKIPSRVKLIGNINKLFIPGWLEKEGAEDPGRKIKGNGFNRFYTREEVVRLMDYLDKSQTGKCLPGTQLVIKGAAESEKSKESKKKE